MLKVACVQSIDIIDADVKLRNGGGFCLRHGVPAVSTMNGRHHERHVTFKDIKDMAEYSTTRSFHNGVGIDLWVIDRNNVPILVPPRDKNWCKTGLVKEYNLTDCFWVVDQVTAFQPVAENMPYKTRDEDLANSKMTKTLMESINIKIEHIQDGNPQRTYWKPDTLTTEQPSGAFKVLHTPKIETSIRARIDAELILKNKQLYFADLGVVICHNPEGVVHPESMRYRMDDKTRHVAQTIGCDLSGAMPAERFFTLSLFIIDNSESIGQRWVILQNKIYKVPSYKDARHESGFYYTGNSEVNDRSEESEIMNKYCPTGETLGIKLFSSFQEALSERHSDPVLEAENIRKRRELEELRHIELIAQHKRTLEKMEQETKLNQEKQKTQETKTNGDAVKAIGSFLVGVLGILGIIAKWLF